MPHSIFDESLSFKELRRANVKRCVEVFHKRKDGKPGRLDDWTPTDWATALAGEVGELCNIIKKMKRLESADKDKDTPEMRMALLAQAAAEAADVQIYLDILTAALGINLSEATRTKFNLVSDERGCDITL